MGFSLQVHGKSGIEVVDVEGEIDIFTAPRLREVLVDLVSRRNYFLVVNLEKVEFLDVTGLGVLEGGLESVRKHDGALELVCTRERILKLFRITGLIRDFGIHESTEEAIAQLEAEAWFSPSQMPLLGAASRF